MSNFDIFRGRFKGDVLTPSDLGYVQALTHDAAVVAFVKDPRDIVLAIGIFGASSEAAIEASSGLVIDLSRYLNNVKVDPKKRMAYAQGGATWRAVDHAAIQHGLAAVDGVVNHTGVGGLILGGGYGWQSGAHGLAADSLVQVKIVTADGSILTANEHENPDLFWAVRGGGSNFGVVTEFLFKLYPQRRTVFAGRVIFSPDACERISAFLDAWWPTATPEEGMVVSMVTMQNAQAAVVCYVFYNGSADDGREAYRGLFNIGPLSDWTGEIPYEQLNSMMNPIAVPEAHHSCKKVPFGDKPSQQFNHNIRKAFVDISSSTDYYVALLQVYIPRSKINSVPADATPCRRDLPGESIAHVQWKDDTPEKSQGARAVCQTLVTVLSHGGRSVSESTSLVDSATYDQSQTFFGDNYARLQTMKKKYDQDSVFSHLRDIPDKPGPGTPGQSNPQNQD
ncbi:hypothetical protein EUX98_g8659 [Antrodiella citrinella]|uniref:FAD-binding PCMH-type domain-containing protein n=1 Tax=Antrodiella citrinella TaxID=2447956 RepID=A0A4S4M4F9_9APHY|nr:hypothetical protein EUX98_g8659 [Antrodiella citrinella]